MKGGICMKVLVPVDGSEYSLGAVRFLSGLNFTPEDELRLLYVVDFVPMSTEVPSYMEVMAIVMDEVVPRILEEAESALSGTKARVSTEVKHSGIAQGIIDVSEEQDVDLIVMGSKGKKVLEGLLLGSTTRAVAHRASVPVLVIRRGLWNKKGPIKVMVATDGTEYSQNAIETLKKLPIDPGSEITVIHVVHSAVHDIPERFFVEIEDRMKELVERTRTEEIKRASEVLEPAVQALTDRFSRINTLTKVGDPSEEILQASRVLQADLIVTGCRGRTGLKGILGSVSRDVLRHADCSVMVCKRC